jgi:hypothetical protein
MWSDMVRRSRSSWPGCSPLRPVLSSVDGLLRRSVPQRWMADRRGVTAEPDRTLTLPGPFSHRVSGHYVGPAGGIPGPHQQAITPSCVSPRSDTGCSESGVAGFLALGTADLTRIRLPDRVQGNVE